jgi:hypothetical protein
VPIIVSPLRVLAVVLAVLLPLSSLIMIDSAPASAPILPHYFLADYEPSFYRIHYMDVVRPSGNKTEQSGGTQFMTRKLERNFTYSSFNFHLFIVPDFNKERDFYLNLGWINYPPGGLRILYYAEWVSVPRGSALVDHSIDVSFTVPAGERLYVRFEGFGVRLLWADTNHSSYVATQVGPYEGQPVPEFSGCGMPLMIAILLVTLCVESRKGVQSFIEDRSEACERPRSRRDPVLL